MIKITIFKLQIRIFEYYNLISFSYVYLEFELKFIHFNISMQI